MDISGLAGRLQENLYCQVKEFDFLLPIDFGELFKGFE